MKIVHAGDTAKFPVEIYSDGILVNPTSTAQLKWVRIVVYSRVDSAKIVGRYSFGELLPAGWAPLILDTGARLLYLVLSSIDTAKVTNEELVIQVTTCMMDSHIPGGDDISTGTAVFCKVKQKEGGDGSW